MKINTLLVLVAGLLFSPQTASAQITIDANATNVIFAPGSTSANYFADTWNLGDFANQTGENQTWDFSSVVWPDTAGFTQLSQEYPSGTLLQNEAFFQSATHTQSAILDIVGNFIRVDNYFVVSDQGVDWMGLAEDNDFDLNGTLEVGAFFNTPGDRIMSFPMTMGSTWSTEFQPRISANGLVVDELMEKTTHTITGWGQANAFGSTADCLRDDFKTEIGCASGTGFCGETNEIILYCVPQTDGPLGLYMVFADLNSDGTVGDLFIWIFDSSLTTSNSNELPSSILIPLQMSNCNSEKTLGIGPLIMTCQMGLIF